jgi:hypothetical protein
MARGIKNPRAADTKAIWSWVLVITLRYERSFPKQLLLVLSLSLLEGLPRAC